MKINIIRIATVITVILSLIAFCMCYLIIDNNTNNQYPNTGIITDIDSINNIVTFKAPDGNCFSFYGIDGFLEGDILSVIMDNGGTVKDITDDRIKNIRRSGSIYEVQV